MRQGNGSEILGASDPRSANIGIIYVAPTDDRESVLAAILTQERLGRKQVAVVLPDQNKAFQHPIDFDGLKNMRRKLQAQIVFVAPAGPGPAELARQRRFPVYSSLEFFAQSLQEDAVHSSSANGNGAKAGGWSFGRKQKEAGAASPVLVQPVPAPIPSKTVLSPVDDASSSYAPTEPDEASFAPVHTGDLNHHPVGNGHAMPAMDAMAMPLTEDETIADPPGDEEEDANELDVPLPPIIPLPVPGNAAVATQSNGAGLGNHTDAAHNGNSAGPSIIELSPRRSGSTGKLAVVPAAQAEPQASNFSTKRRNTGKMAAAVAAGAVGAVGTASAVGAANASNAATVASATGAGAGSGMSAMSMAQTAQGGGGGGAVPPRGGTGGSGGGPGGPPRSGAIPRWVIAAALVVLTLLLVFGGIAYAAPGVLKNLAGIVPGASASTAATITIIPASKVIKNTYVITAVTGKPNVSQRQVQARNLSFTTPSQSRTVNATGVANIPGKAATGTLTFFNGSSSTFTVAVNTVLVASGGIQVENTVPAVIPASNPPNFGTVTVAARAVNAGASGNIRAGAVSGNCCASGNFITVRNQNAFTGGQDQAHYMFVQQSDIDGAAKPLEQQLNTSALNNVKGQKKAGEQYVNTSNPIQCTPNVTSNHKAGDKASNVTVTVSVGCAGEVYDQQAAETMAVNLYKNDSTINPGTGFALTGNVSTSVGNPTPVDNKGTISLLVTAQGTWVYQITSTLEKQWAQQIAGKSKQSATSFLQSQPGVGKVVSIQLSTGNTLPTDPNQITFVIQNVTGGSGTPTPGSTPSGGKPTATPTPVNGLGGR